MSILLTEDEIIDVTHRRRRDCQIKALVNMGIEHRIRPDGSIAVLRAHFNNVMGGAGERASTPPPAEFNWGALNA